MCSEPFSLPFDLCCGMLNRWVFFCLLMCFLPAYGEYIRENGLEIYLVGAKTNISRIVWIFPGYITERDSYKQRPEYIVRYWKLDEYPSDVLFVIPVVEKSVYPLYEGENFASWRESLRRFRRERIHGVDRREIFIGISSGVEGTIKFVFPEKKGVFVWLSGTFDYVSLDRKMGEYLLHERIFGSWGERWLRENPLSLLMSYEGVAYVFCEKSSIFYHQQERLLRADLPSLRVVPVYVGAWESGHNWAFWGDERVVEKLREIILEN